MRVTNSMIFGNSMNNLNRNMKHINGLVMQIETRKLIQRPSDDPILANRAMRYRTILEETNQFIRNVQGGLAWMEVTESALMNLTQGVLQQFNTRLVEGATGTLTLEDRLGIVKEMRELIDQIALEMNQTYMGRYVFSGYRTTQPPIFTQDNNLSFVITQQFNARDIERIKSFQKHLHDPTHNNSAHQGVTHNANVLKLAYSHVNFDFSVFGPDGNPLAVPGIQGATGRNGEPPLEYQIVVRSLMDADAYTPPSAQMEDGTAANPFVVHYIKETGELVFSDEAMRTFRDGTTITYHKEGFKQGELNPVIYFDSIEVLGINDAAFTFDFTEPPVDPLTGRFNFAVDVGGAGATNPGLFELIGDGTQGPIIRIGGHTINLWDPDPALPIPIHTTVTNASPPMWETVFAIGGPGLAIDVNIIQRVTIGENGYDIGFSVINYGDAPINFDFLKHINPSIGGYGNNLLFDGNDLSGMGLPNMQLTPNDPDATLGLVIDLSAPDRVHIGDANAAASFTPPAANNPMTESAFAAVWENQVALPDTPLTFTSSVRVTVPMPSLLPGDVIRQQEDWIVHEISPNNHQRINDLARLIYTDKMYTDLKRLLQFTESIEISDHKALEAYFMAPPHLLTGQNLIDAINKQISDETAQANAILHDRFNNLLKLFERHTDNVIAEHARLGTRMDRFDMMEIRLTEDDVHYQELLSATEDTRLQETIMRKNAAEAAMHAALRATAMTVQLSLVHFLR